MPERRGTHARGVTRAFRFREFRVLWTAEVVSVAGDQLARVALAVAVFGRTGSPLCSAVTYALTFLPAILGGVLLGGLADRFPRREVMVACDVVRAILIALMAIAGLPLWGLWTVLVLTVLVTPVHTAAQGALLPTVLPDSVLECGFAVRQITGQAAQVAGFALGGVLITLLSPPAALLVDAATFIVSALVLRLGLPRRPPACSDTRVRRARWSVGAVRRLLSDVAARVNTVVHDPRRRTYACVVWLIGCYVVPEALAAPYAARLEADPSAVGLLMAADPAGSVVGAWLFTRYVPDRLRDRAVGPLAVLAGLPLLLCAVGPGLWPSILLWAVSGAAATAGLVQAQAGFVRATPDRLRGGAIGLAAAGLTAVQGVAALLGGAAAQLGDTQHVIVGCGLLGMIVATGLWVAHRRLPASPETPTAAQGDPEPVRQRDVVTTRG